MTVSIARVYEPFAEQDGYRVLVDRLWPRGMTHERAHLDDWLKAVAPSPELRTWFGHRAVRFEEFATRYRAELDGNPAVDVLRAAISAHARVTLLYGAHDPKVNHAVVLRDYLG